jgi:hypothetical protein
LPGATLKASDKIKKQNLFTNESTEEKNQSHQDIQLQK